MKRNIGFIFTRESYKLCSTLEKKKKDKGKTVYAKFKDGKCTFDFRP